MQISILIDGKNYPYEKFLIDTIRGGGATFVYNSEGLTRSKFWNSNFDKIDSKYILFLSPEVILTPNALTKMLQIMESDENTGAVGSYMNFSRHNRQNASLGYKNFEEMIPAVEKFESEHKNRLHIFLEGECLLVRKSVLEKIRFVDGEIVSEKFTRGIDEGVELSFKIWKAGFKLQLASTFVHWNYTQNISADDISSENCVLEKILGFSINYTTTARTELLNFIPEFKDGLEILEIGCAAGGTLLEIKNRNPKVKLFGIEINPNSAKISSSFGRIENADVEKFFPEDWHEKFDYIICGDVIEHLINPWSALKNIREMLKPSGHLLASIPNIIHISVVSSFLHGFWKYEDAGILDRTHLRFFTLDSIKTMLLETRLMGNVISKPINISDELNRLAKEFSSRFNILSYNFLTFQWLIDVHKF